MDKKKILIVEDEPEMRRLLALELETEGYEIFQAEDGQAGLDFAKKINPDLIISDVLMPNKDGNKFLKELRQTDFGKDIPFIVLTARAAMRDYFEVMGVDDFLEKPFKNEDLLDMVEAVIHKRALQKGAAGKESEEKNRTKKGDPRGAKDEIIIINEMTRERFGQEVVSGEVPGATANVKKEPRRPQNTPRKKILILENDMVAYYELQKIFLETGGIVQFVGTPGECIEEANRVEPDLIILKQVFKKIDAEELANKLKIIPHLRKVPIIIYTHIGEKVETANPAGVKTTAFVLNDDGKEMIRKVADILET